MSCGMNCGSRAPGCVGRLPDDTAARAVSSSESPLACYLTVAMSGMWLVATMSLGPAAEAEAAVGASIGSPAGLDPTVLVAHSPVKDRSS